MTAAQTEGTRRREKTYRDKECASSFSIFLWVFAVLCFPRDGIMRSAIHFLSYVIHSYLWSICGAYRTFLCLVVWPKKLWVSVISLKWRISKEIGCAIYRCRWICWYDIRYHIPVYICCEFFVFTFWKKKTISPRTHRHRISTPSVRPDSSS